ncbi:hypothetical protein SASPL_108392 [Salvia splendens]|uniref:Uncharacterized protein n=1 Tax=Salvia splendens TaxID=180675 RepID=A0A8X8YGL8_SALSN|nr:hypothetical protein SASPL_108392 [Salvia splendens]
MAAVLQFRRFQGKHGLSRRLPLLHPNLRSGDQLRHQTHVQAVSPNPVAGDRQRGYGERDRGSVFDLLEGDAARGGGGVRDLLVGVRDWGEN